MPEAVPSDLPEASFPEIVSQIQLLVYSLDALTAEIAEDRKRAAALLLASALQKKRDKHTRFALFGLTGALLLLLSIGWLVNHNLISKIQNNSDRIKVACTTANASNAMTAGVFKTFGDTIAANPPPAPNKATQAQMQAYIRSQRALTEAFANVQRELAPRPC